MFNWRKASDAWAEPTDGYDCDKCNCPSKCRNGVIHGHDANGSEVIEECPCWCHKTADTIRQDLEEDAWKAAREDR